MSERSCKRCGVEIRGTGRKYCADCAEIVKNEQKAAWLARKRDARITKNGPRRCCRCGAMLKRYGKKYCATCAFEVYGRKDRNLPKESPMILDARERLRKKLRLSGDEIAALAWEYGVPYDSYGKLRAYVDQHDALPPDRFLRRYHPDTMMMPVDRAQYERAYAERRGQTVGGSTWLGTEGYKPVKNGTDHPEDR